MTYDITTTELPDQPAAVLRGQVPHDGIAEFLGQAFGAVMSATGAAGVRVVGPPFARYRNDGQNGWEIEAGFPVEAPFSPTGGVEPSTLPGGMAARLVHHGSYDTLAGAWKALEAWVIDNGYTFTADPWEAYLDEPDVVQPRTEIVMPCAVPHTE